ncbi:MAG: GNAT family N-acetyltransferase [Mollicutes bacterium]|nr:GNAT family N-acetyltransferase [Mollicutes bacterium]
MIKLKDLKIKKTTNIDDYLNLYNIVLDNLDDKDLLGAFTKEDVINILENGGKIWLYYDNNIPVCSIFLIPVMRKTLDKHNLSYDEKETTSVGPVMVHPNYRGNKLQKQMILVLEKYAKSKNYKYIFTKVSEKNIRSKKNFEDLDYKIVNKYENERGVNIAFIKKI